MKCPCCKYEYVEALYGMKEITKVYKSGKNKGKEYTTEEWGTVVESVGDEDFSKVEVIATSGYHRDLTYLNICPKCGVAFKEV